jgi:hypothetical protein
MERMGESDYQGDFRRADNGDWKMTRRWVDGSLMVRELSLLLVTLPPSKFCTPLIAPFNSILERVVKAFA